MTHIVEGGVGHVLCVIMTHCGIISICDSPISLLPIKQLGFSLSKAEFWAAVYLRYGLPLKRLPSLCDCSKVYTAQYPLSCKKGGFVNLRHNELRDNTVKMLQEVSNDVRIEQILQPLTGEEQSISYH